MLVGFIATQVAGVLGVLIEIDQRVEQCVEAAGPREVGRLHPARVRFADAGGGGEGEQSADAKRGRSGGGDQLPPLEVLIQVRLLRGACGPFVELVVDRGKAQGVVQRLRFAAEPRLAK